MGAVRLGPKEKVILVYTLEGGKGMNHTNVLRRGAQAGLFVQTASQELVCQNILNFKR